VNQSHPCIYCNSQTEPVAKIGEIETLHLSFVGKLYPILQSLDVIEISHEKLNDVMIGKLRSRCYQS
jgi:hypothetical protein